MSEDSSERGSFPGNSAPVERVRQEVDRWLEAVRTTGERAMETLGLSGNSRPTVPPVDLIELPDEVVVLIDLPGIAADGVELSLVGNMLTISAKRTQREFSSDAGFHFRERFIGQYNRSIPIPSSVDNDAIRAEMREGQLTVTLKKLNPVSGRSIPISTGNG